MNKKTKLLAVILILLCAQAQAQITYLSDSVQLGSIVNGTPIAVSDPYPQDSEITIGLSKIIVASSTLGRMDFLFIQTKLPDEHFTRTNKNTGRLEKLTSSGYAVKTENGMERMVYVNLYEGDDPRQKSTIIILSEREFIAFSIKTH